jgi:hypothetical protein
LRSTLLFDNNTQSYLLNVDNVGILYYAIKLYIQQEYKILLNKQGGHIKEMMGLDTRCPD